MIVLAKRFFPDEIHEIADKIFEQLQDLPVDEHGFIKGDLCVTVTFEPSR